MSNFTIGLSGLNAAQSALDVVGNNVANAATEGYHRQRIELSPATFGDVAAGVSVVGVTRMIDTLLESEIMRQESSYGQVSQELSLLSTVETALAEFSDSGGLNATIDTFFESLRALAANPLEHTTRSETLSSAQALTSEFRRLGSSLTRMGDEITLDAQNAVDSINGLAAQIAELNAKIQAIEVGPGQGGANNMRDQRDQMIVELSKLIGAETQARENGIIDVTVAGIPVVTGSMVINLTVGASQDQTLVLSAAGAEGTSLEAEGGRLGGLLSLKNELLANLRDDLDTLTQTIVYEVNRSHVQGLGPDGSFQELTGWSIGAVALAKLAFPVTDGTFYVRVTNTTTGEIQRHAIAVNVSGPLPDTAASIAAKLDALDGLGASVNSSRLCLVADQGYTFDFLPAVLPVPTATDFTAASPPIVAVSGLYTGAENHVFTFTVAGAGAVGNGALQLQVSDENGDVVSTVNVGDGYAAGETIVVSDGLKIAVSTGALNLGDNFQVEVFATTDTSGFLAAAGMNAFFSGASASEMRVSSDILDAPDRIAAAWGANLTDNAGALRLASLQDTALDELDGMTPSEYYQRIVANLGEDVAAKQSRQENVEAMLQNLQQQKNDLSSVNINDEAALLLVFQQMFQAVAKYLTSLQATLTTLIDLM